jgi:hypothetical protein
MLATVTGAGISLRAARVSLFSSLFVCTCTYGFRDDDGIANSWSGDWLLELKKTGESDRWLNYFKPDIKRGNLTTEQQLLSLSSIPSHGAALRLVEGRFSLDQMASTFICLTLLSLSLSRRSTIHLPISFWSDASRWFLVVQRCLTIISNGRMEGLWHHWRGRIQSVEGRFLPDPVLRTFISSLPFIFVSPDAPFFFPSPSRSMLLADSFS